MAEEHDMRLLEAVLRNDLEAARRALVDGADVHARVVRRGTTLEAAMTPLAWTSSPDMVDLLLGAGAVVDAEDSRGLTPLRNALNYKHLDVVDLLLRRGADPNYSTQPTLLTPVEAALDISPDLGRKLLEAGGRITEKTRSWLARNHEAIALIDEWPIISSTLDDRDKQLMLAARAGNVERISALLEEGASIYARDTDAAIARDHALAMKHLDVARLLERIELAATAHAALFLAVLDDHGATLREHVATFDLGARTPDGLTALMLAARYRRHDALAALLTFRPSLDERFGLWTALTFAIDAGDLFGMLLLLEHGASVNVPRHGINPVLTSACKQDDADLLKHLLARGLDLAPYPDARSSGEHDRLLENARAGILPHAGLPEYSSWSECRTCRDLPATMGWCQTARGEYTGEPLPAVTAQFETFNDLWKCALCATYYVYTHEHDNGIPDGWDSERLNRIALDVARELLEASLQRLYAVITMGERLRIEREIARMAFAEALAAPGRKCWVAGKDLRDGKRALRILHGAERVASHEVPESELDAIVAELEARGLERAETNLDG